MLIAWVVLINSWDFGKLLKTGMGYNSKKIKVEKIKNQSLRKTFKSILRKKSKKKYLVTKLPMLKEKQGKNYIFLSGPASKIKPF